MLKQCNGSACLHIVWYLSCNWDKAAWIKGIMSFVFAVDLQTCPSEVWKHLVSWNWQILLPHCAHICLSPTARPSMLKVYRYRSSVLENTTVISTYSDGHCSCITFDSTSVHVRWIINVCRKWRLTFCSSLSK